MTEYGEALVRAMVANHVMVDVSHMSQKAIDETFALLDELDPTARCRCSRPTSRADTTRAGSSTT